MHFKKLMGALFGAVLTVTGLLSGPAQAALQDRDLDGNGVTDAFYDTDLNITWLRDANVNGVIDWDSAVAWAADLSFGGYSDWRLPSADPSCGTSYDCIGSEMGHLWYVELGNPARGPMTNTGGFQDFRSGYWSGTEVEGDPFRAWYFLTGGGFQNYRGKFVEIYALAVRPGDVTPVPEPETYAMMLAGLAGLALARRVRKLE